MKKKHRFSIHEIVSVILVVGFIGLGWCIVRHIKHSPSYIAKSVTHGNSYTLRYEKLNFKYPKAWKLADYSSTAYANQNIDWVELQGPGHFAMEISDGSHGFDGDCTNTSYYVILHSEPVTFTNKPYYLNYFSWQGPNGNDMGRISQVGLGTNMHVGKSCIQPIGKNTKGYLGISMMYKIPAWSIGNADTNPKPESIKKVKSDANYQTAAKIIESMSY